MDGLMLAVWAAGLPDLDVFTVGCENYFQQELGVHARLSEPEAEKLMRLLTEHGGGSLAFANGLADVVISRSNLAAG